FYLASPPAENQALWENQRMEIRDHVFIVTGASSGIGRATATALAGRGAKVAVLARTAEALQELARMLPGSLPVAADMTDFERVRAAVAEVRHHYGRVDGLVNNAGRGYGATIEAIEPALFDEIFHLNVLGPVVAMQAAIPLMRALMGISLTARAELDKDGIVVSEIYPFITATNFGRNRMGKPGGGPAANYSQGDTPEFVASLVLQAIEEGGAQYFANERLRKLAGA